MWKKFVQYLLPFTFPEIGPCRRFLSKTLFRWLFCSFTSIFFAGILLTLQGSLIVFIALCNSTFGVPVKKLKSAHAALHTSEQSAHNNIHNSFPNIDASQVMKVKRDLNLEKLPESFNVLDRQMSEDKYDSDFNDIEEPMKRGRNWEIRSASGTRMPMVRPTGLKGFFPTVSADSEGCEAVCSYCKDILSMRWAALCVDQCYKQGGGRAYDACYITFHLRDQIHWQYLALWKFSERLLSVFITWNLH